MILKQTADTSEEVGLIFYSYICLLCHVFFFLFVFFTFLLICRLLHPFYLPATFLPKYRCILNIM